MFGEWLDSMMTKYNITTKDIAKATKSHPNVVRNWIRNKNYPNLPKLVMLVLFFERLGESPELMFQTIIRLFK